MPHTLSDVLQLESADIEGLATLYTDAAGELKIEQRPSKEETGLRVWLRNGGVRVETWDPEAGAWITAAE